MRQDDGADQGYDRGKTLGSSGQLSTYALPRYGSYPRARTLQNARDDSRRSSRHFLVKSNIWCPVHYKHLSKDPATSAFDYGLGAFSFQSFPRVTVKFRPSEVCFALS